MQTSHPTSDAGSCLSAKELEVDIVSIVHCARQPWCPSGVPDVGVLLLMTLGKTGLFFFVTGGAILALITTLNALFIVGTKSLLMIVQDRLLPG